jgi:VanZ family protein
LNLRRWLPPILWLGAILTATSIPGHFLPPQSFRFEDKLAHTLMYGVLGFLLARAMDDPLLTTRRRAWMGAFLLCITIGATDEWHQKYIQGRSADGSDWVADATGGLIGASIWMFLGRNRAARTA